MYMLTPYMVLTEATDKTKQSKKSVTVVYDIVSVMSLSNTNNQFVFPEYKVANKRKSQNHVTIMENLFAETGELSTVCSQFPNAKILLFLINLSS